MTGLPRHTRLAIALLALAGTLLPMHAGAAESPLASAMRGTTEIGHARLRVWGFEVYDARLFAGPGFEAARFAEQPLALELSYLRRLQGSDIAARSLEEMRELEPIAPAQAEAWLAAMRGLFPDVNKGDRITGVHQPGRGALFFMNDRPLGAVADVRFSRLFFGIWLSPKTSQPALRATLLQGQTPLARTP